MSCDWSLIIVSKKQSGYQDALAFFHLLEIQRTILHIAYSLVAQYTMPKAWKDSTS